jgi:lipoyl(octanoyl) transferase
MRPVIYLANLGLSDYRQALCVQRVLHAHCRASGENVLVLTQHYPVVTLGYRRPREQLRLSAAELAEQGIALAEVERGGGATYHGPGQLVAYPVFSSLLRKYGVRGFVARLEEVMCGVSHGFGVAATRQPGLPGVWVGERKLGAVGIAVRGGASLHGCALNVNIDLQPFAFIVPCGLTDKGVTSLERESGGRPIPMSKVEQRTCLSFAEVFAAVVEEMPEKWCSTVSTLKPCKLATT